MERIVSMIKYKSIDEVPKKIMNFNLKFIMTTKPITVLIDKRIKK
jgi:hypothetical protein